MNDVKKKIVVSNLDDLIFEFFGIKILTDDVRSAKDRLGPLVRKYNCNDVDELFQLARKRSNKDIFIEIADKVITSYSYFYREKEHFDYLKNILLPELVAKFKNRRSYDIRIWSGACSTGEEAYTIAIILKDILSIELSRWSAGVLATDISAKSLSYAKNGIYEMDRLMNVDSLLLDEYFDPLKDNKFKIKNIIKDEITFRSFNLKSDQYPFKYPFHIIFLRNVLMYFDDRMLQFVIDKVYENLDRDGYLFVSKTDTFLKNNKKFQCIEPGVFKKV